jgi:hypothetical protein
MNKVDDAVSVNPSLKFQHGNTEEIFGYHYLG